MYLTEAVSIQSSACEKCNRCGKLLGVHRDFRARHDIDIDYAGFHGLPYYGLPSSCQPAAPLSIVI